MELEPRTHETQRQLTYQLCFINVDDDFQDSLFSVYQHCAEEQPIIIILSENGELRIRGINLTNPDADFYNEFYANCFLDAFYRWRTPLYDHLEESGVLV